MKKPLRIGLYLLALFVTLFIALAIALSLVLDPDEIKNRLSETVSQKTGRAFTVAGAELALFPWLGVKLHDVKLGNAVGFGDTPMARLKTVQVHVRLWPVLQGNVELDKVVLDGLQLDLQRNRRGQGNWEDLLKTTAPVAAKTPPTAQPADGADATPGALLETLSIAGVNMKDSSLHWRDARARQDIWLKDINLASGSIVPGQPFQLDAKLQYRSKTPRAAGRFSLSSGVLFDPDKQNLSLANLTLNTTLSGEFFAAKTLQLRLGSRQLALDLSRQILKLEKLTLESGELKLSGEFQADHLLEKPHYAGKLQVASFAPRKWLSQLGIKLPPMADPRTLQKAALSLQLDGTTRQIQLSKLTLKLDDSTLSGRIKVSEFDKPALQYRLKLDRIDLDRYLPPTDDKTKSGKTPPPGNKAAASGKPTPPALPLKPLRRLKLQGTLKIGQLKASKLRSKNVVIPAQARRGRIRLAPLHADLYQGHYQGDIRLDVSADTPRVSFDEKLQGVQIGPLLKDYWGDDKLQGKADLSAKMSARGQDPAAIRKTLNGTASFVFRDGAIKGIDVAAEEAKLKAVIKGKPAPKSSGPQKTGFSSASGSLTVTNGLVQNNDLRLAMPHARGAGAGKAYLVTEQLDYTLRVKFSSEVSGQSGQRYEQMDKVALPIHVRGSFTQPDIKVDYGAAAEALAKREVKKQQKKLETKAKTKIKKELENALDKLFKR